MTDHNNQKPSAKPTHRKRGLSGMQVFAPYLASTKAQRDQDRQTDEQDRAERRAIAAQASEGPLNTMYRLMGHSPNCIAKMRRGLIVSCDCPIRPMEDPAVAVGMALHYEKFARAGSIRFPKSIVRLVEAGADAGDEACRMMLERLRRNGCAEHLGQQGDSEPKPGRPS